MTHFHETATIADEASLSDAVILNYARVVNIEVGTWAVSAAITFQATGGGPVSGGGSVTWYDVYDELGVEVQIPAGTHNKIYSVPALAGMFAIKVRSGVTGSAVNQTSGPELINVFGKI